jgi:hypothetical protein
VTSESTQESDCAEQSRLRKQYDIAAADYSRAVKVLAERSGVMSIDDYNRIRDFCETARVRSEAARAAMDRHIAQHGC